MVLASFGAAPSETPSLVRWGGLRVRSTSAAWNVPFTLAGRNPVRFTHRHVQRTMFSPGVLTDLDAGRLGAAAPDPRQQRRLGRGAAAIRLRPAGRAAGAAQRQR